MQVNISINTDSERVNFFEIYTHLPEFTYFLNIRIEDIYLVIKVKGDKGTLLTNPEFKYKANMPKIKSVLHFIGKIPLKKELVFSYLEKTFKFKNNEYFINPCIDNFSGFELDVEKTKNELIFLNDIIKNKKIHKFTQFKFEKVIYTDALSFEKAYFRDII